MHRLTEADLHDRIHIVLMRYTPERLKLTPRDKLVAEIVEALAGLEIIGFKRPVLHHAAGGVDPPVKAAHARACLNSEALEKVARDAVTAILAIVDVRQR